MAANPLTLAGLTLPPAQTCNTQLEWIGGAVALAAGGLRRDLLQPGPKRRISLAWTLLTAAELTPILTAYTAAVAADVPFTGPDSVPLTVNAGTSPGVRYEAVNVAGGALRFHASLELFEA